MPIRQNTVAASGYVSDVLSYMRWIAIIIIRDCDLQPAEVLVPCAYRTPPRTSAVSVAVSGGR
jgi:hypothetical protein